MAIAVLLAEIIVPLVFVGDRPSLIGDHVLLKYQPVAPHHRLLPHILPAQPAVLLIVSQPDLVRESLQTLPHRSLQGIPGLIVPLRQIHQIMALKGLLMAVYPIGTVPSPASVRRYRRTDRASGRGGQVKRHRGHLLLPLYPRQPLGAGDLTLEIFDPSGYIPDAPYSRIIIHPHHDRRRPGGLPCSRGCPIRHPVADPKISVIFLDDPGCKFCSGAGVRPLSLFWRDHPELAVTAEGGRAVQACDLIQLLFTDGIRTR